MKDQEFLSSFQPFLQEKWEEAGFEAPTGIQKKAIPAILEGGDVIAKSPTGTGKTLAYLLPLIEKIDPSKPHIQAVVLASSQELVMQIFEEAQKWTKGSDVKVGSFIGGANVKRQVEKLKKNRPHIAFGTPGRVNELIKMKKFKMHEVKTIVIDEGDQLLIPEHISTVQDIIKSSLSERQVLLFSATLAGNSEQLADDLMSGEPHIFKIERDELTATKVDHIYFVCEGREKLDVLRKFLHAEKVKALGFVRDIGNLVVAAEKLEYKGISLGVLHSEAKKEERATALKMLRKGDIPLLLATDVAARGLDVEGLTHVIHVDFPQDVTQYTHRSGRTGRGGKEGTVVSIVTQREERTLKQFAKEMNVSLTKKVLSRGKVEDAN
ncbi:DEAD/DEAH box helicase [Priestia endophytica]|jgi:superfamily II DNA/RNA helicase|uniref:RNA helicase n=1 Tax=Priestia endophytica TaxID=135735 RepID=A0AAX1QEQ3_9BACI|nr:DEAD/DEAH box helicase [Priestia endophytica]MCM3540502.1 DEAD/DEAH box helicase [Priestia endophytica]RAS80813.1 RNA helicase [Priestia endophytica]RAS92353.1 RNA helicase [Priestia endophytica]